jgi:hypothetical protein
LGRKIGMLSSEKPLPPWGGAVQSVHAFKAR